MGSEWVSKLQGSVEQRGKDVGVLRPSDHFVKEDLGVLA